MRDFDLTYVALFSGIRHDSGGSSVCGDKIIDHYKKLGININMKTLLFSDSLNFEKQTVLIGIFPKKGINITFGIGTYIANDTHVNPLTIVMKTVKCND